MRVKMAASALLLLAPPTKNQTIIIERTTMDDKRFATLGDILTLCSEYGAMHQKDGLVIKLPTTPWKVVSDFKA
ncbi:MAG: hypothetical protein POG24_10890, partial [Acidocella sp.]|nr:hypothetical protein [Acidocella sp.]